MFLLRDNILIISNITAGCVPSAIRTFTMAEFDDPLESCPGREGGPEGPKLGIFTLTPAGVRALLGRKRVRSRPLLKLTCCGCGRSSWDNCRFVPTDLIEWVPQCMTTCKLLLRLNVVFFRLQHDSLLIVVRWALPYYRLTKRMKEMGLTEEQPSGPMLTALLSESDWVINYMILRELTVCVGDLCNDCHNCARRAFPNMTRVQVVESLFFATY